MGGLLPKSLLTRSSSLHSQCQRCHSGLQHFLPWLSNGLLTGPQLLSDPSELHSTWCHMLYVQQMLNPLAGPQLLAITQVGTQVLYDLYLYTIIPGCALCSVNSRLLLVIVAWDILTSDWLENSFSSALWKTRRQFEFITSETRK